MPDDYTPTPGSFMARVDKAGGIEAYKLEQAKKFVEAAAKIKPKQWIAMTETIGVLGDFLDSGVSGAISDIGQDFQTTLSLQVEAALAPLQNQINQALSEALAPIMPEIVIFTNEIAEWFSIAIGSWKAIITGEWEEVFADISKKMPDWFKEWKNEVNQMFYDFGKAWSEGWEELGKGWEGFWKDIGAGWSGFWRDLGWQE